MFEQKNLNTLEYPKILEMLASFCQSTKGKQKALSLLPLNDINSARISLQETAEADRILFEFSVNPNLSADSLSMILSKSKKGAILSIVELLQVARVLRLAMTIDKSISTITNIPLIMNMVSRLYYDASLEKIITDSFVSDLEVSDNATIELKAIRQKIRKLNANVKSKLQSFITSAQYSKYIQDTIITMRGDRYVIPLKSECKGAIHGLIHDQSASGSTIYVEPMQVVELNNELRIEKSNEVAEINRILKNLSQSIASVSDNIEWSYQAITDIDLIFAKAHFARKLKASCPQLNDKGIISIEEGRHPLIDQDKVVSTSISMESEEKMLLITGPNTGGKTVTLKLIGLFSCMALTGMFIPAKFSNICIFDGVFCDIGDEQSIEQSLSTFSSHIKNIISIIDKITPNSLVLFDELGAGTDPSEGASLAISIAEHILKCGSKAVITSHFNDLKEFSLTTPSVIVASMEFDIDILSPTFRLIMGTLGSSNALDIACRLGLDIEIVDSARKKISPEKREFDNVLSAAEETRRKAQILVYEATYAKEKANSYLLEIEKEKQIIEQKREKLDENIRRGTKVLIEDSVIEADEIINQLKELLEKQNLEEKDIFVARKLKTQLISMSAKYDVDSKIEIKQDNSPLNPGDTIFVKSLQKIGVLKKISSRGEAEITFGNITSKVKKNDFFKVKK